MSMGNYATYGFGIALTDKEAEEFLERNHMEEYDICEIGGIIMTDDDEDKNVIYLDGDEETPGFAIVFPFSKWPSLFEGVYHNAEECVKDVKTHYDVDFGNVNLKQHIAEFSMVQFG